MSDKQPTSDIVERAQKLMRMADGGTEHEAEVAYAKLQRLMVEYNLDIQQVRGAATEEDYVQEDTSSEFRMKEAPEDIYTLSIIQDHFFVKVVFTHDRDRETLEAFKKVVFIGRRENVDIAKMLYFELRHTYRFLWSNYKFVNKCPMSSKPSFYAGLTEGLDQKIRHEKSLVEAERGLVLVKDSDLENHFNKLFPGLGSKSAPSIGDWSAYGSGQQEGRNINLRTKKEVE